MPMPTPMSKWLTIPKFFLNEDRYSPLEWGLSSSDDTASLGMILGIDRKVRLEISGDESLSFWEESEVVDVDRDVPGQLTLDLGVLKIEGKFLIF